MPSINITTYGGIRPAVTDRLLDQGTATVAHNTKLTDGTLRPFREPLRVGDEAQTLFVPNSDTGECRDLLRLSECASVVPVTLDGYDDWRFLAVFPDTGTAYLLDVWGREPAAPLGIEPPMRPVIVSVTDVGADEGTNRSDDVRSYTYTWVDRHGVESAPAPATRPINARDTATIRLAGFSIPPSNAAYVRIYRTGAKAESEATQPELAYNTNFLLVDEVSVSGLTDYIDNRRLADLEFSGLDTTTTSLAPRGLKGVASMDSGYYVGFAGNAVMFSERNQPWNWPDYNSVLLPDKVTGVAVVGSTVFVATQGQPFVLLTQPGGDEVMGEQRPALDVRVLETRQNLPGVSARSITATNFGAVYVSEAGLIGLTPDGAAVNLTRERLGETAWADLAPSRIVWQDGYVYGTSPHKPTGLRIELRSRADGANSLGDVVTIDMRGHELHAGRDGKVYYANEDGTYLWEGGDGFLTYTWTSKKFVSPTRIAFTAAKVEGRYGAPVNLALYKFNERGAKLRVWARDLFNGQPIRLPRGRPVTQHMFELTGTAVIEELHVATSVAELTEGP